MYVYIYVILSADSACMLLVSCSDLRAATAAPGERRGWMVINECNTKRLYIQIIRLRRPISI